MIAHAHARAAPLRLLAPEARIPQPHALAHGEGLGSPRARTQQRHGHTQPIAINGQPRNISDNNYIFIYIYIYTFIYIYIYICGCAFNVVWQGSTKGPFCRWSEIPGLTPVVGLWGSCLKPKLTTPTQASQARPTPGVENGWRTKAGSLDLLRFQYKSANYRCRKISQTEIQAWQKKAFCRGQITISVLAVL